MGDCLPVWMLDDLLLFATNSRKTLWLLAFYAKGNITMD